MNTILIDNKSISEWFSNLPKYSAFSIPKIKPIKESTEFEIRLTNITKKIFEELSYSLSLSSSNIIEKNDIVEFSNKNKNLRKISSEANKVEIQLKEKCKPFDINIITGYNPLQKSDIRFAKSFEITYSETDNSINDLFDNISFTRNRTRTTFYYTDFHIDLTEVESTGKTSYEVEIESDKELKTIEDFFTFLKNSLHQIYPNLHTLFSSEKYDSIKKFIDSRTIPYTPQPTNIQEKHLLETSSSFIGNNILDYSVTNKLDGVNYKCHLFKGKKFIIIVSGNDVWLEKCGANSNIEHDAILNTEVYFGKIYVFELLYLDSENNILHKPLKQRLEFASQMVSQIDNPIVQMKRFFSESDIVKNIHHCIQFMTESYGINYKNNKKESGVELFNDGIVLQYNGSAIVDKTSKIVPSLKWKFPNKITIDLLANIISKTDTTVTYALYCKGNKPDSFIHFKTESGPAKIEFDLPQMCDGIDCSELSGKVLELGYDREFEKFKLFRIRRDKTKERTNSLYVVNETFPQMVHPFTLPIMINLINSIRDTKLAEETYTEFIKGQYPYKYLHTSTSIESEINRLFNNLKHFNVFDNKERISHRLAFYSKGSNQLFSGYIPTTEIIDEDLKQTIFKYKNSETGKLEYLTIHTLPTDYNNMDKITDYFCEPIRTKAIVKSENISSYDYFIKHEFELIDELKNDNKSVTNYNMRELLFKKVKEATLFKVSTAKAILEILASRLENFNISDFKWLDISAGWGDRLITAIASNVKKYVAFDPNIELKECHQRAIETLAASQDLSKFKIIYEPFEKAILNIKEKFNLVFTSPPFFDFEIYTNATDNQSIQKYPQFNKWMESFLFKSLFESWERLEDNGFMAIYIMDIGNYSIVEPMYNYIEKKLKNSVYIGLISLVSKEKIPKPVWIWQKSNTPLVTTVRTISTGCEEDLKQFRKHHNSLKQNLIIEYTKNKTVLDLGSGRGGDLIKFEKAKVKNVVFCEPSVDNLNELKRRLNDMPILKRKSETHLIQAEDIDDKHILGSRKFDIITLFFMLTFFFENEEKLDKLIDVIDNHLEYGGYIIGTTANGKKFEKLLRSSKGKVEDKCFTIEAVDIDNPTGMNKEFGKSIIIDLKATLTSTYQKEYLVHIPTLVEKLFKKGIQLVKYHEYEESESLSAKENLLTKLYSEFVFRKVKSVDIGETIFTIGSAPGDGSCLFYSIVQSINPSVVGNDELIEKEGKQLRENIVNSFNLEDYVELMNGSLALKQLYDLVEKYKTKIEKYSKKKSLMDRLDFDVDSVLDVLDNDKLVEKEKDMIEGLILLSFDEYVDSLKDCTEWSDIGTIEIICKKLKINILVYDLNKKNWYIRDLFEPSGIVIILGFQNDNHFVPLSTMNGIYVFGKEDLKHIF
jgi:SAM-dependent methyltransferase/16S rRNA G966 N2-methylase RsmD